MKCSTNIKTNVYFLSTGKCGKQKTLHTAKYFLIINQVSINY